VKPAAIVGMVLIVLGAVALSQPMWYPSTRDVMKIGDLKVTAETRRAVPPWVSYAGIAAGVVLVGVGLQGRKQS